LTRATFPRAAKALFPGVGPPPGFRRRQNRRTPGPRLSLPGEGSRRLSPAFDGSGPRPIPESRRRALVFRGFPPPFRPLPLSSGLFRSLPPSSSRFRRVPPGSGVFRPRDRTSLSSVFDLPRLASLSPAASFAPRAFPRSRLFPIPPAPRFSSFALPALPSSCFHVLSPSRRTSSPAVLFDSLLSGLRLFRTRPRPLFSRGPF
jgi:hypothetical protein